jgi:hypothetical protein
MEKKSPKPADLTVRILEQIRDQVAKTNERLDDLRTDLTDRIDRLERRQTEDSIRLGTAVVGLAEAIGQVRDLLRDRLDDRAAIVNHEARITALERRAG